MNNSSEEVFNYIKPRLEEIAKELEAIVAKEEAESAWINLIYGARDILDQLEEILPLEEKLTDKNRLTVVQGMLLAIGGLKGLIQEDSDK